ncbi:protein of unknown function DUF1080 [Chthoniobacter flavus Ellin428]|uniref:3-keto-alpha-glucoside-1,2-lyase/3-keto-2-hydroxy-glucal hydratase domain-containing protein n=1 Tax=Chthoniobacter flavus Ellin428 TaxID=497964 RepID=B4D529_9BACT|nr:DUF1080 domain-containing protein [Chthoniobacter flavus]EDY18632.1 protein of unknown function DUF1080 [Chthoniobacter flavus Ellin428]TCO90912.1 uncharacterized protein DUF1080 [Chthoniobacter flavus]
MLTSLQRTIVAFLIILTCRPLLATSHAVELGFTSLLDSEHIGGWKYCGDGEMKVEDGVATTSSPGNSKGGLYWFQERTFADFTLKLEFKVDKKASNSGVYLRFPNPGDNFNVAGDKGYEVDIYGEKTGTIIFMPVKLRPAKPVVITPGEWNEMTVTVVAQRYTVQVNGQTVNDFLGNRASEGYIGLQNYPGEGNVHFREVRIKDLSAEGHREVAGQAAAPPSKQIEPLLEPCLDAILAPLPQEPQMPRVTVEKLRATLSGEAVKARTPSQKQIFQYAIWVCDALTNGMDERAQTRAAAVSSSQVPSLSNGGSIVNTMPLRPGKNSGNAGEAIRKKQKDERAYADQQAQAFSAFMESSAYKAWVTKSTKLRRDVMSVYTKLVQLEAAEPALAK